MNTVEVQYCFICYGANLVKRVPEIGERTKLQNGLTFPSHCYELVTADLNSPSPNIFVKIS